MRSVMFRRAALMGLGLLAILIPIFGAGAP